MWHSYFRQIQNKYSMRISLKNPLVIRLDGKNVTKNKSLDLLNNYEGSFLYNLEKTVKYFAQKYHCYAIFGSDEVSFIFINPRQVIEDLDREKNDRTNEIVSMFAQYFFDYFNGLNHNIKVFWHAKCFSISSDKIKSYIKYRSGIIKNVMTTYYLKKKNINMGNEKLNIKEQECEKYDDIYILKNVQDGIMYYNGERINLQEFYKGNIEVIEERNDLNQDMFLDLLDF